MDRFFVTFEMLAGRKWRFFHLNGPTASYNFSFEADGKVGNYDHKNERFWEIKNGTLCLLSENKTITVVFDADIKGGEIFFSGKHLPNPDIVLCLTPSERVSINGTKSALEKDIKKYGWSIGEHTYGVPNVLEKGLANLIIGRFCSIAGGVTISLGNHRMDMVSTYPFSALRKHWTNVPTGVDDHITNGDVVIGNDVWIGTRAIISSGVTIGHGSVIGAGSVVTKSVEPYSIIGGAPAKLIRYRFSPKIVSELLDLNWWDFPDDAIDALLPKLMSPDIEKFIAAARRVKQAVWC